ncbi:MAG: hypothetical protein FVQ77_14510 [Cytophagales bacterium]|nr:hypothetical protein [Cytophagales bacterium]
MNFLFPQFLFGLSAIAIPIVIHLFNFQRPKKFFFTNVRFLKNVKDTTTNKLKLKHLLVLLARILFIAFLVLAFAQPFIPGDNSQHSKDNQLLSIYIDNSFSMQNDIQDGNALDVAIRNTGEIVKLFPANTQYHFIDNDFEGKDQFLYTPQKLEDRITEVNFSNISRNAQSILNRQSSTVENIKLRNSLANTRDMFFWFSDFQKSTTGDLTNLSRLLGTDTSTQYYLVPIQVQSPANVFTDSVWLASPFVKNHQNNILNVKLVNDGDQEVNGLEVKFFIGDRQVSIKNTDIAPHASAMISFNFVPGKNNPNIVNGKWEKCKISYEYDAVDFDNEYYFVLEVAPVINIVHILHQDGIEQSGLHQIAKNSGFINKVFSKSLFNLNNYQANNIDYNALPLADLIILNGLRHLDGSILSILKEFVKNGGSVLIFPIQDNKNKSDFDIYINFFKSIANINIEQISEESQMGLQNNKNDSIKRRYLLPPDINDPFFEGVFENIDPNELQTGKKINMPYAKPVISWKRGAHNLLAFKNKNPFLSFVNIGKGKIYFCAAPLQVSYTNFPKHAIFVPFMYRIAILSVSANQKLAWSFQEKSINLDVTTASPSSPLTPSPPESEKRGIGETEKRGRQFIDSPIHPFTDSVRNNGGGGFRGAVYKLVKQPLSGQKPGQNKNFELIPDQRLVGKNLTFILPKSEMEPGFYELKINQPNKTPSPKVGAQQNVEKSENIVKILAFNYGKNESYLKTYHLDELKKTTAANNKNVRIFEAVHGSDFINEFKEINFGISLWKYCMTIALIFLLVEILLIRFL